MRPPTTPAKRPAGVPARSAPRAGRGRDAVRRAVARSLAERSLLGGQGGRVVLAVSGGLDSMVLLEAAARAVPGAIATVATFDHGTGPAAARAAAAVARRARALGLPCEVGTAPVGVAATEAAWRAARWAFLRDVARRAGAAAIVTAHTADDQVETVFLRALRGAGARGLAGLAAPSPDVVRPFLALGRAELRRWAARHGVAFVEDPSNASRRHLRNRARLDLLPALERARPGFRVELLAVGERAAAWRRAADALAERLLADGVAALASPSKGDAELRVKAASLAKLDGASLAVLWPALAARAGVTLDWRGTRRLAEFTMTGRSGGLIQLSGGVEVVRRGGEFVLRRPPRHTSSRHAGAALEITLPTAPGAPGAVLDRWRFDAEAARSTDGKTDSPWTLWLPIGVVATTRPWRAGDRMRAPGTGAARRVKRFFGDAGVAGVDRAGWPVVLADGEIVWIPGVRRAHAAPAPSGRPGVWLTCRTVSEPTNR